MTSILLAVIFFFSPDSLTKPCNCQINQRFEPLPVNKDTLHHYYKKKQYKSGLILTLHFLNKDSTDRQLYRYLGEFSYQLGEKMVNNKNLRNKKYSDNPYVRSNVVQDTSGYIVVKARQTFGPKHWTPQIKANLGHYAACSFKCDFKSKPFNPSTFTRYFHLLIAINNYDQALKLVKNNPLNADSLNIRKGKIGPFYLELSRIYIAYGDYKRGLKFAKFVINNFDINRKTKQRWNEVFHHAIRTDDDISRTKKPYYHVSVEKHIPEIEDDE